jgi:hypothetical protein
MRRMDREVTTYDESKGDGLYSEKDLQGEKG